MICQSIICNIVSFVSPLELGLFIYVLIVSVEPVDTQEGRGFAKRELFTLLTLLFYKYIYNCCNYYSILKYIYK